MDTVLYGAAYYPEYMPYERADEDIALMKKAGISVVRVGESTWGLWEPEDGKFEYAWMDKVIEKLHAAGIRVVLGTPTYSIPAWMYKKHPEMVVTKLDGKYLYYGMRQNTDLMNAQYRFYCERIIRKLMEHYKDNPAVIGYQVDNETSSAGAANADVQTGFKEYLQKKFKTVDEMDKAWGLNYSGPDAVRLERTATPRGILNPGWKLEWERYSQWETTDFLTWQAKIVNEYKRPDQFVTHDFASPPRPEVNEVGVSRGLDIAASNPYHGTQDNFDGEWSSLVGDYTRSLETHQLSDHGNERRHHSDGTPSGNFHPTMGRCGSMCIPTYPLARIWWSTGIGIRSTMARKRIGRECWDTTCSPGVRTRKSAGRRTSCSALDRRLPISSEKIRWPSYTVTTPTSESSS